MPYFLCFHCKYNVHNSVNLVEGTELANAPKERERNVNLLIVFATDVTWNRELEHCSFNVDVYISKHL